MNRIYKISVFLLLFFALSFLIRSDYSFDQDLGRHLRLGEIIMNQHFVPNTNLFSYTSPDFSFINHHFLFEVLLFLGQQSTGLQLMLIFKIIIILSALFLMLLMVKKSSAWLILPIGFIFFHIMRERIDLRPEIFSFLFTSLIFYILHRYEKQGTKLIFAIPVIQLLWVNFHIYFPVGFLLQGIFLIHFLLNKQLTKAKITAMIVFISAIFSLLNPNSFEGLTYPLRIFGNYGYSIAENQNLFFLESIGFKDPNFFFAKLAAVLIILGVLASVFRNHFSWKNTLLASSGLILAYAHIRSLPYLIFLSFVPTMDNFGELKNKKIGIFLVAVTSMLLLYESLFYWSNQYYLQTENGFSFGLSTTEHAKGAVDFMLKNNLPQPIFNNFDIGSYIIYRTYPSYKVFVDGRPEAYPADFFQQIYIPIQEDTTKFSQAEKKYGFQTIIFSHTDQTPWAKTFLAQITKNPEWTTVYLDNFMIILIKKGVAEEKGLKAIQWQNLEPENYHFDNHISYLRMGLFLLSQESTPSAQKFVQKSIDIFPESQIGRTLNAYLGKQSYLENNNATNVWW